MRLQNCLIRFLEMVLASERLNYWLVVIASWGKKYWGDLIAGVIAFLIPFLITWALKGVGDIVAITSFFGLIVLLFILLLSYDPVFLWLVKLWRKTKFSSPIKIGILDGYLDTLKTGKTPTQPFTQYSPQDWFNELSSIEGFDVNWIVATEISDQFDIILNPFGEVYPEIDKPNLSTLHQIRKFVEDGGIFVNVAGLAFYYAWDGQKEDLSGPLYQTYKVTRLPGILSRVVLPKASHLRDCSLYKFFGIRTTFFDATILSVTEITDNFFEGLANIGGFDKVKEFRSTYRSDKKESILIPILKASHKITVSVEKLKTKYIDFDCYPISAVNYGKGYLLLNGMALEKSRPQDFKKAIESIKSIAHKLNFKGFL